ncbi:MAG: hypothetical protein ACOYMS_07280 [Terrimicrobiaceae bacterium]
MKPLPLLALLILATAANLPAGKPTPTPKPNPPAFDKFAKGNVTITGNIIGAGNPDGIPTRTLRATVNGSKTVPGPLTVECLFVLRSGDAYNAARSVGSAGKKELPAGEGVLDFTFKAGAGQGILGWILRAYRGKEVVGVAAYPGKYDIAAAAQNPGQSVRTSP